MKVTRHKKIRKILHFYEITQQLRPPYRVVVDGAFLQACRDGQIMLKEQLPTLFHAPATAFVTPCIGAFLKKAQEERHRTGVDLGAAAFIASTLPGLKCRHPKGHLTEQECIRHLIREGNPDRLIVGAQNPQTRQMVRDHPGVPLLFIHGSVPVLEHPSAKDRKTNKKAIDSSLHASKEELKLVQQVVGKPEKLTVHRRKVVKGPNPLSCKRPSKTKSAKESHDRSSSSDRKTSKKREKSNTGTSGSSTTSSSDSTSTTSATTPTENMQSRKRPRESTESSTEDANSSTSSTSEQDPQAKRRRVRTRSKKSKESSSSAEAASSIAVESS